MTWTPASLPVADLAHTSDYCCLDNIVTVRAGRKMEAEGGLRSSLFDQALLGPALTCSLRGLRVDHGRLESARVATDESIRGAQARFESAAGIPWKWGRGAKPAPAQLATLLYQKFKVRVRLSDRDTPSVAKDKLADILEDPKTPEAALPVVEIAMELSGLEEDRKALRNPLSPDGRLHCSFLVAAQLSGRWSGRKNAYNGGIALYGASDPIRNIVVPDPGYILVGMDQMQGESRLMAYLVGSKWWQEVHDQGNVHIESGKVLLPKVAHLMTKAWAKSTDYPGRPGKKYYDMTKAMSHACLDAESEVLTKRGWVSARGYDSRDEIAVWSPDGTLKWETPQRWTAADYDGLMVRLASRNVDLLVTPNHKLPMWNNRGIFYTKYAGSAPFSYGQMPTSGVLEDSSDSRDAPTVLEARLLAATWADGYLRRDGWTVFGFAKNRKIQRLITLLSAMGIEFSRWAYRGGTCGATIAFKPHVRKRLGWDMLQWPLEIRKAFLDELVHWDGNVTKGGSWRVFNVRKCEMEVIATLCHVSGRFARIRKHGILKAGGQQCWLLHIGRLQRNATDQRLPASAFHCMKTSTEHYNGKVYCPTTTTGWFLMRRNGLVCVTGNSDYCQTYRGLARQLHIPEADAREAQNNYFKRIPELREYHQWVAAEIKTKRLLVSPMGRVRQFLGRVWEAQCVREAVSWQPQSGVSDFTKVFLYRLWKHLDSDALQVLFEHHDACYFQVLESRLDEIMPQVLRLSRIEVPIGPATMRVRWEVEIGESWLGLKDVEPDRLAKWESQAGLEAH